jgi:hypothetical protein
MRTHIFMHLDDARTVLDAMTKRNPSFSERERATALLNGYVNGDGHLAELRRYLERKAENRQAQSEGARSVYDSEQKKHQDRCLNAKDITLEELSERYSTLSYRFACSRVNAECEQMAREKLQDELTLLQKETAFMQDTFEKIAKVAELITKEKAANFCLKEVTAIGGPRNG